LGYQGLTLIRDVFLDVARFNGWREATRAQGGGDPGSKAGEGWSKGRKESPGTHRYSHGRRRRGYYGPAEREALCCTPTRYHPIRKKNHPVPPPPGWN